MQEQSPDKPASASAQAPWSEREVAQLKELARGVVQTSEIERQFPHRSASAIKAKITRIRRELGIPKKGAVRHGGGSEVHALDPDDPGMDDSAEWRFVCDMVRGSTRLVAAIHELRAAA